MSDVEQELCVRERETMCYKYLRVHMSDPVCACISVYASAIVLRMETRFSAPNVCCCELFRLHILVSYPWMTSAALCYIDKPQDLQRHWPTSFIFTSQSLMLLLQVAPRAKRPSNILKCIYKLKKSSAADFSYFLCLRLSFLFGGLTAHCDKYKSNLVMNEKSTDTVNVSRWIAPTWRPNMCH